MDQLGKYIIEEPLGEGGMGMVYRALDPVIGRHVAIKVIHRRMMSPGLKERFYREAQSVGRLAHENVTTLFDVGEQDGDPYLVLELLGGTDLRRRMQAQPPLTLNQKLDIAEQICRGLAYAHEHGVIHRDIKPDNIRILDSGRVKIMDFGLARVETETLTHSSMGTPRYMSPEQIKGTDIDHRTDIFSFGVLFYELLSGTNPFSGDRVSTIVYKIVHEEPEPPAIEAEGLTEGLQQIVVRCIQKEADLRYPSFDAVLEALAEVRGGSAGGRTRTRIVPPRPPVERPTNDAAARGGRSVRRVMLLVLVPLLVALGAYFGLRDSEADTAAVEVEAAEVVDDPISATMPARDLEPSPTRAIDDTVEEAAAEPAQEMIAAPEPVIEAPPVAADPPDDADVRAGERRAEADEVRAVMERARADAQDRYGAADTTDAFQRAEAGRREGDELYGAGRFEMAAERFEAARQLYDDVEAPPATLPPPVPAPDPSAADDALAGMEAVRDALTAAARERPAYREAVEAELRADRLYAAQQFDEAEEAYRLAAASYEAAARPLPREEVEQAVLQLSSRMKQSLEAKDVDALQAVHAFYEKSTWRSFLSVVDDVRADVQHRIDAATPQVATVQVSLRLQYRNNKNAEQENVLTYTWKLEKDAAQAWVLSEVENR